MIKKNTGLAVLIFALFISELLLTWKLLVVRKELRATNAENIELQQQIHLYLQEKLFEEDISGYRLPEEVHSLISKSSNASSFRPFNLVLYFKISDCNSCLESEIQTLNSIAQNSESEIGVYGIVEKFKMISESSFKKSFRIKFPIYFIDNLDEKIYTKYQVDVSPILLFCESTSGLIIKAYHPTPLNPSKNNFIETVERFSQNAIRR